MLIAILLVVIVVLAMAVQFFKPDIEEGDASKFVIEDLSDKYPSADVGIMTITEKTNDAGDKYFEVKARVVKNHDSPCPVRSHVYYNYPVQNFIPQPPDVITSGCKVCTEGICNLAFPEEAVIASHTFEGTEDVQAYLDENKDAVPYVDEELDFWKVTWISEDAQLYYIVEIHRNGTLIDISSVMNV